MGEARSAGLPLVIDPTLMVPGVDSYFVISLLHRAFGIRDGFGESYERTPTKPPEIFRLTYGGSLIAVGTTAQLDAAERIHCNREYSLEHPHSVAKKCLGIRDLYIELSKKLDRLIDIRVEQRTFSDGPCEICEAWGGLNTRNRVTPRRGV